MNVQNKITYKADKFTPGWATTLDRLAIVGTKKEPVVDRSTPIEPASWKDLLVRLLAIQRKRGYKPGWTIHQALNCGNPPFWLLVKLAQNAGYTRIWASKKAEALGHWDEHPNFGAIDWAWDLPDVTPTNYNDIPCDSPTRSKPPKPLLRNNLRTDK
jgi:hypothetical protein